MKVLVTGAKGFIGKNLVAELQNRKFESIFQVDKDTDALLLDNYTKECEFVFHLAGINRTIDENEFMEENYGFTELLLNKLREHVNRSPILITSSIQAELDNPYGKSKKRAEDLVFSYGLETGSKVFVYRLPNVFGKWCKPNYNSVVATFCNNIAKELEIKVNDPEVIMNLVYIDDVVNEFINALKGSENRFDNYCSVPVVATITLGELVELIKSFREYRVNLSLPNMRNEFVKKLYCTYLSYLSKDQFSYPLKMQVDSRGSFTEFIRTPDRGQISVNISKPGIIKGNHWHNAKVEKFLVVQGRGLIQLREIQSNEIINYHVTGERLEVVDIPIGYAHNIINEGDVDLITLIWANEEFDPEKPDTYCLEV